VTFVTFLRFFDILGFAKKNKNKTQVERATWKCHKVRNCDIVTFENVTKCHTFSNVWYKATFTFYVWIRLGTALILEHFALPQMAPVLATLRQHLAENAQMLGSTRHDWHAIGYVLYMMGVTCT